MSELLRNDETWMRELLAPLERMEPVELPERASSRPRVLRRPLAVAACVVATLVLATGIAIAADVNPFNGIAAFAGIGAVDRPPTAEDALSPDAAATLEGTGSAEKYFRDRGMTESAQRAHDAWDFVPDSARLVGELPGGHKIYVVATRKGSLCVLHNYGVGCSRPPGDYGRPGTLANRFLGGSYGITSDGVTAVSFMAEGREQTVQVVDNFWIYKGEKSPTLSITFHLADGRTHTTTYFRNEDHTWGFIDTLPDGSTQTTTHFGRREDGMVTSGTIITFPDGSTQTTTRFIREDGTHGTTVTTTP